jgi:hypothetical protein
VFSLLNANFEEFQKQIFMLFKNSKNLPPPAVRQRLEFWDRQSLSILTQHDFTVVVPSIEATCAQAVHIVFGRSPEEGCQQCFSPVKTRTLVRMVISTGARALAPSLPAAMQ